MKREGGCIPQGRSILQKAGANMFLRGFKLAAAMVVSAFGLPLMAQQLDQRRTYDNAPAIQRQQAGEPELEKENLNFVAAAPAQIKEVLIKDPGLLVELKRWIAKEASNNGQIVNEENLTDTAVLRFVRSRPDWCNGMDIYAPTLIQTPSWERNKSF